MTVNHDVTGSSPVRGANVKSVSNAHARGHFAKKHYVSHRKMPSEQVRLKAAFFNHKKELR